MLVIASALSVMTLFIVLEAYYWAKGVRYIFYMLPKRMKNLNIRTIRRNAFKKKPKDVID